MSGVRLHRLLGRVCVFLAAVSLAYAGEGAVPLGCFEEEVLVHVRAQFAKYGPLSNEREYFGFIYRVEGQVGSAVTHGSGCRGQLDCSVNTAFARARIPKGAKVLGEWHTHPQVGSSELSMEDVNGAHANWRIRCYSPFYSTPDGAIYRWDIAATSVPDAMASRTQLGSYRAAATDLRMPTHNTANAAASINGDTGSILSPSGVITAGSIASPP
jgi:hypothetical protein